MVFTVQKEAARRMASSPGTKDYASYTVLCRSVWRRAHRLRYRFQRVLAGAPRDKLRGVDDPESRRRPGGRKFRLHPIVRSLFSSRRKTIVNNLRAAGRAGPEAAGTLVDLGFSRGRSGGGPDAGRASGFLPGDGTEIPPVIGADVYNPKIRAAVIKIACKRNIIPNKGVMNLYQRFIAIPMIPHSVATAVGQNMLENPSPNW